MKIRVWLALALGQVRKGHAERMRLLVGPAPVRDIG